MVLAVGNVYYEGFLKSKAALNDTAQAVLMQVCVAASSLESLSNYDGDANENATQKTNFTFLKPLRYYPN